MLVEIAKERVLLRRIRKLCSKTSQPGVSIIASTNKAKYIHNILSNYTRFNYLSRELIIILNNNDLNINNCKIKAEGLKNVRIFQLDEGCTLGECLNFGINQSKYDYISKMDDDDYYGANYLIDLMNVFKYEDVKVVGKCSCFIYFEDTNTLGILSPNQENKCVPKGIAGGTLIFQKDIIEKVKFRQIKGSGTDYYFLKDCNDAGIRMFSADKFNYVYMRHKNLNEHTWKVSSEEIMREHSKMFLVTTNFSSFANV